MKDKYFGDINDYRKYGLIRPILRVGDFRPLIAWMLTPDDVSRDGKFTVYLSKEKENLWRDFDRELYDGLQKLMHPNIRKVSLIEQTNFLPGARYFSRIVPDTSAERRVWLQELLSSARDSNLVFLDPDNGLQVKSKPYGKTKSSKYLYWHEVNELWNQNKSLLIYQHFCRIKRVDFIRRIVFDDLPRYASGSLIEVFSTPNVAFFLALQPDHKKYLSAIVSDVQGHWSVDNFTVGVRRSN